MASMTIKNKYSISFYYMVIRIRNKMINKLIYTNLVCRPSIITNINSLII
jgi:hypothetical protein